jgi:N,N'-diacetyllegionaminate synthase
MIKINNHLIKNGSPVFVIAEAGVNHNGDINIAKKLIDIAVDAGADAVKFQTYKTENLVTNYANMAEYQKNNIGKEDSQFNMLKKLELSFDDFIELKDYCDSKNIIFMSTPFDFESADFLNEIGVEVFKISSPDLINIPLLIHIAEFKKPIILSSGMSNLSDIEDAIFAINYNNNENIAVLHCTSNYPADIDSVNLSAMDTIRRAFKVTTGYSDHTEGITIASAAAARGAAIIEKHFTLDKNMDGPDHKASLEPYELKSMINNIRLIERALGDGIKKCKLSELDTVKAARKSIVAGRNIKAGEIIKFEDLNYKRPGTGMMPKFYKDIIGKKASGDIQKNEQIAMSSICE